MAPVPATIQVDFTSNYSVGQHRVCFRIQGSGDPYVCQIVNCTPFVPPGSQACVANLVITVDNESCEEITYEGYVQPTCESEESLTGREPFTVTFVPNPSCIAVVFTCDSGPSCAGFSLGSPCDMTPDQLYPASGTIANGTSFSVCYVGGAEAAPNPPGYIKVDDPLQCCYDCVTLTFVALNPDNSENGNITYIDCATGSVTTVAVAAGGIIPSPVCAKRGSIGVSNDLTPYTIGPVCTPP